MRFVVLLLLAAPALHFDITDARGKKPAGVTIEAGEADADGWRELRVTSKAKGTAPVLVWPYDGRAKVQDGPGDIPVIVVQAGGAAALKSPRVAAAMLAGALLGGRQEAGVDAVELEAAADPWAKGVGLLYAKKAAEAVGPLAVALRERERQLTRVPSEIYPAAMLYGRALFEAGKYDDAAVAFLKAMKQRPSDAVARKARAEALIKAGKPESAEELLQ